LHPVDEEETLLHNVTCLANANTYHIGERGKEEKERRRREGKEEEGEEKES